MSTSLNLHYPNHVAVYDLGALHDGTILIKTTDKDGNDVTVFGDDEFLRKLVVAMQGYAAKRDTPPAPKPEPPTYAATLFAPAPGSSDEIPF